jgi:hypothetical protein
MGLEKPFDALLHYDRAIMLDGKRRDVFCNRGTAFNQLCMFDSAKDSYERAIEISDDCVPHAGLGSMYASLARLDDAEREFTRARELEDSPSAHVNLSQVLFAQGRWKEAHRHYESRWDDTPVPPAARRLLPAWRGESLAGKTILLYPEQGYGDEIMAMRFADQRLLGAKKVILQARGPMAQLAEYLPRCDEVVSMHDVPSDAECSAPSFDVPMLLGMGPQTVWRPQSYLTAPTPATQDWWARLSALPEGLNVGVCWQTGGHFTTTETMRRIKSLPTAALSAFRVPGVNLISLQKPLFERPDPKVELVDWTEELDDFADTAALIAGLDLVISVDTAVAHLAGALGKPVLNLVRFNGFWPWSTAEVLGEPEYSMWYPSMRLLRQTQIQGWQQPLERAVALMEEARDAGLDRDARRFAYGS